MLSSFVAVVALCATGSLAQLSVMRATIPGAIHQCEDTNVVFFQSGGARPLQLVFLPSSQVPDSMRSGTVTLAQAAQLNPVLVVPDITAVDNLPGNFEMAVAEGSVIEAFGFLPDGSGKALSLTRTIMTPLPAATNCVANAVTTIAGYGGAAAATTSAPVVAATSTTKTRKPKTTTLATSTLVMPSSTSTSTVNQVTPTPVQAGSASSGVSVGSSGSSGATTTTAASLTVLAALGAFLFAL